MKGIVRVVLLATGLGCAVAPAAPVFTENGGLIVFEAEDFSNSVARSAHSWILTNDVTGFSGAGFMQALPDNGSNINANTTTTSPELQYTASFAAVGTRYVWVRGYGADPDSDSVHVGINGVTAGASNVTGFTANWGWTNFTASGAATITASAGTNTISVWMREDGFRLDRVLLTTNANFKATTGNVFHIPSNIESNSGNTTMRSPLSGMATNTAVFLYTGNQYQGSGNPGNQLQTGSTIFYRNATNASWSSIPMFFWYQGGASGNNKYYSNSIPANAFSAGDTVQYYFKIPYDDHLPTFIYGNDSQRLNTELESVAQSGAFSYTYATSLAPNGPYVAITNNATGAEGRIYLNSGHVALGTNVVISPPTANTGSGPVTLGAVLSSSNIVNGIEVRQAFGSTSIVAQITFPYDGVMRYEVVNWGGQVINNTAVTAASDASEHFYGFGEKFADFDKAGKKVHIMTEDQAGDKTDDAYKVAPWFISTKGYGFHLDATTESWFDMRNQFADRYVISNFVTSTFSGYVTNALKFNLVYGPKLTDVLTRYTAYTGRPAAPPKWAFAPWMSSDIWHDGGEVRYAVQKYRALAIPGSTWVFDSPWEVGYNDFTWNTNQWKVGNTYEGTFYNGFNTTADMMTFLRTNGFYVVCWMTPFINTSSNNEGVPGQNTGQSANYATAAASNYFVRASVGGSPLVVNWWKGTGSPVDFTNPNAKLWLQNQLSNLVAASGGVIAGFKTDDGESGNPANNQYIPTTAVYADGRTGIEMRNGYCVEYHRAIWNVLGTNGLLFARSGFTGSHAYPGYWAGDNQPNFNEPNGLPGVVIASQSAAMSGYSIWASDIGGYQNGNFSATQTNLFMRWTQFGAFSPLMQMHRQVDSSTLWQYPWGYGADALTNYIYYARLHTALFPYIYTLAVEGSTNGLPIMRPLVLLYPNDSSLYGLKQTFMFGNDLLVSQIISGNATTRNVQLPQGNWYDFFSNLRYVGGQTIVWTNSNQSQMPLFARDGAIIPMISTNVMTLCDSIYVSNPAIATMSSALEFLIYPTTNSSFTVYDGTSVNVQSNGTVVTATLSSIARPIKMRFRSAPAAGVERDGIRLTTFTNLNAFVEVTFDHTGGTTQITFGPDTDADGIPDPWAMYWFGTTNVCASCDPDGDGFSNAQEYLAGTAPNDASNYLRITIVQPGSLSFASVAGMSYRVEFTDDLSSSWLMLSNIVSGSGVPIQINDPNANSASKRFYRVKLLP